MLKIRVIQQGQQDLIYEVAADEAVLGRVSDCDATIPQSYVSKRHVKVLAGIVVVDLGSSNGTHVEGKRIDEPVLLKGREFTLGAGSSDVRVQVEHHGPKQHDSPLVQALRKELDSERRRSAELSRAVNEARAASRGPAADPESLPLVLELRASEADLRRRLDSLKQEIETRDLAASEGLQARLASDALAEVQRQNSELRAQVAALESRAAAPTLEAAKQALAARVAELEADHAEDRETIRRLQAELEAARRPAEPAAKASDLFFKLQAENSELRRQLEEARAAPAGGTSEVFFGLQAENRRLAARVEELEQLAGAASPPAGGAGGPDDADAVSRENHQLRMTQVDLQAELESLRSKLAAAGRPRVPATHPPSAPGQVADLLRSLAEQDVESRPPLVEGDVEAFLALELFRFMRQSERVITRIAGAFIELLDQRTILPDVDGNLRELVIAVIVEPDDAAARRQLISYLEELRRWLVVALGANRRAAERFVDEIRSELSERALTASAPIPALRKVGPLRDAELWSRASQYVRKLTADVVEDRLKRLTQTCADEIRRDQDRA